MAGAYVNSGTRNATANNTSRNCALPASLVNGNILIATCCVKNGDDISISGSGWAQFGSQIKIGTSFTAILAWRIVDGGEGSVTFSWSNAAAAQVHMHQFSGTAPSPIGAINSNSGSTSAHSCTGITTTRDNSFVIYIDMAAANTALATPSGWTEDQDGGSATSATRDANGSKTVATSGSASGDISVTGAWDNWVMYQVELLMPSGTASITQASDTIVATATIASGGGGTGSVSLTQASDTVAATGTLALKGTTAIAQASDTVAATGTIAGGSGSGSASITQAGDTLAATGTITVPAITITAGAWAAGSTAPAPTLPASPQAGDVHILFIGGKPYDLTRNAPSGWTLITGTDGTNGSTASGTQVGSVAWAAYYRVWQSGDSNPTISWTGGFPTMAVIHRLRPASGYTIGTPAGTKGQDTSSGTGYSATMSADPGITTGDVLIHYTVTPNNLATFASPTITATSATIGTVTENPASEITTTTGADGSASAATATVTSGTATAAPVCAWTLGAASTGGSAFVRIRQSASAGWANISKINGVTATSVAKVNGIDVANISKVNGVSV